MTKSHHCLKPFKWPSPNRWLPSINPTPSLWLLLLPLSASLLSLPWLHPPCGSCQQGGPWAWISLILHPPLLRGQLWQTDRTPFPAVLQCSLADPSPTLATCYTVVAACICDGLLVFLRLEGCPVWSWNEESLSKTVSSQQKRGLRCTVLLLYSILRVWLMYELKPVQNTWGTAVRDRAKVPPCYT